MKGGICKYFRQIFFCSKFRIQKLKLKKNIKIVNIVSMFLPEKIIMERFDFLLKPSLLKKLIFSALKKRRKLALFSATAVACTFFHQGLMLSVLKKMAKHGVNWHFSALPQSHARFFTRDVIVVVPILTPRMIQKGNAVKLVKAYNHIIVTSHYIRNMG
jgi:hypothetical protein